MSFTYRNHELFVEDLPLQTIAAAYGTPCYVYSKQTLKQNWREHYDAFKVNRQPFRINYSVKANSNIHILQLLAAWGSGFDVVSGGEIQRVLAAGGKPQYIVFSGVGKSSAEINLALDQDIYSFHIESEAELLRINDMAAKKHKTANITVRVNPDVGAGSHPYNTTGFKESKFGIENNAAVALYTRANSLPNIKIKGIACHIGSQITSMAPFLNAIEQLLLIVKQLKDLQINLEYIDVGGGLGIRYKDETPPTPQEYVQAILAKLQDNNLEVHIEPGRSIVAAAGILLTKVEYLKQNAANNFVVVDAAMNDLMRPALYQSYHAIEPVTQNSIAEMREYAVVGPICESGDFFAMQPKRALKVSSGDLLAIRDCGAYGFCMSSNYNTRTRCPEILVAGNNMQLIRKRETIEQLLENEVLAYEHATASRS